MDILKKIARRIVLLGSEGLKDPLEMPLAAPLHSNQIGAQFMDGENIQIMSGSIVSPDSRIGTGSYVGFNCHISRAMIGRYVSIADGVMVGLGEHLLSEISTSSAFYDAAYDVLTAGTCEIADDVWIGAGSIVRRGVSIGFGAVVGANSFVNQDVPPFAIVAGSPARFIRFRFEPEMQQEILQSGWSALPLAEARRAIAELKQKAKS